MRRLTVIQALPALHGGGVERGTLELAAALVAAGHRSIVVSAGGSLAADLVAGGSEHIQLALGQKSPLVWRQVRPLAALIDRLRPDVVHVRSRLPAWITSFALKRTVHRPATVTTLHGLNSVSRYSAIMTRADAVIAVSNACRDYWLGHYPSLDPSRVRVIYRGVDPAIFRPDCRPDPVWQAQFRTDHSIAPQAPIICLPGRLTRSKGHGDLIACLPRLRHAVALFPGGGSDRLQRRLVNSAVELGVADRIRFLGHRRDIQSIVALADVVAVLSTKPESFGRAAAEALALGIPVVGYDHGGVGEVLAMGFPQGRIPVGDRATLAETLARWNDQGPPAPPEVQPFTLRAMTEQTLALYQEVVG